MKPAGLDYRTSTGLREMETPVLENTSKILCTPRPRGEEQWPHSRLNQNYLLMLEGLLWRPGSTEAPQGVRALAGAVWESPSWHKPSWRSPLTYRRHYRPWAWVASGQTTTREGAHPHSSADDWIKASLSNVLPTRARPGFSHH